MNMENSGLRILVVEDHMDIAGNIADFLEARGHVLDFAVNGAAGLNLAREHAFDAIVLDIMLPGMDGLEVCRRLRESAVKPVPVLMLTARDTLEDKLTGFEAGADDYLVKPFALAELEARLQALVRRGRPMTGRRLRVAELEYHPDTETVLRGGTPIELNRICARILRMLMEASPGVVSRAALEYALWGDDPPETDALRSHIYTLRTKVDKPFPAPLIHTVYGRGYKVAAHEDQKA